MKFEDTDDPAQPVKQEVSATDDMEIEKKEQVQNAAVDSTDKSGESSKMEVEEDSNNNAAEEEVEVIEDSGPSQPMQSSTGATKYAKFFFVQKKIIFRFFMRRNSGYQCHRGRRSNRRYGRS